MIASVVPLESNPQVFTELAHTLGLSPVLGFHDVYSLTDPDLAAFLPQPVLALIVLFPISADYEVDRKVSPGPNLPKNPNILWFRQTIKNGCGLYALLHALSNLSGDFIIEDLVLNKILLVNLSENISDERTSKLIEQLEQTIQLDKNFGLKGQTEAPEADYDVQFHFITYVKGSDEHIYELDGRRDGPIDLGASDADESLLSNGKVAQRLRFYIDHTDEQDRDKFAVMAISPTF